MKKDKSEIMLILVIALSIVAGLFFYSRSQGVMTSVEIPYEENSSVGYKVYLSDSSYYNKEYLDEGMQYITSIIDYINLDFNYDAKYQGVNDYSVSKIVTADIKITDTDNKEKIIYYKSETLKEENIKLNNLKTNDQIKIDYKKYNGIVNEIKSKYAISANAMLTVSYRMFYSSSEEGINKGKTLRVEIPLSERMITISKPSNENVKDVYIGETNNVINIIPLILMIIMFIIAIVSIISLIKRVNKRIKSESKYDRFLAKVLREYDSYITVAKEENKLPYKDVIKVGSFKDLIDVRNNVEKAIIYTKIDDNTSKFQLVDEQIYEYEVTRRELDENTDKFQFINEEEKMDK